MIHILDPRLWLATIVLALICFGIGHRVSTVSTSKAYELKIAKINSDAEIKYDRMVEEKDFAKSKLQSRFNELDVKYSKEKENADKVIENLQRSVANGSYRLSVAVSSCKARSTDGNSGTADKSTNQEYAELLPETTYDIINIAKDADNEVRRTNQCIDKYNAVRDEVKALNLRLQELSKP